MEQEPIRIIATGGTFDKRYDELKGILTFKGSHLGRILKDARLEVKAVLELNQLIDSLDMRESNRLRILASCEACPERRIVVTHGTDTMAETARVLGAAALPGTTIVLPGAMIPYTVEGSDALFNFGFAFACARLLPSGVYVAMNGVVHAWDRVKKDRERGVFVSEGP